MRALSHQHHNLAKIASFLFSDRYLLLQSLILLPYIHIHNLHLSILSVAEALEGKQYPPLTRRCWPCDIWPPREIACGKSLCCMTESRKQRYLLYFSSCHCEWETVWDRMMWTNIWGKLKQLSVSHIDTEHFWKGKWVHVGKGIHLCTVSLSV